MRPLVDWSILLNILEHFAGKNAFLHHKMFQNVQQNAPMVINFLSLNLVNKMFALFSQGQTKRRTKTNCFGFCLQKTQYLQVYGTIAAGYNFSFYIKKAKEENLKKQALLLIP